MLEAEEKVVQSFVSTYGNRRRMAQAVTITWCSALAGVAPKAQIGYNSDRPNGILLQPRRVLSLVGLLVSLSNDLATSLKGGWSLAGEKGSGAMIVFEEELINEGSVKLQTRGPSTGAR